jgi:hypothetical protein
LQNAKDKRVVSRLTTDLLKVVKTDATNDRGLRTIEDGDMSLLQGFEFNTNSKLGATLFTPAVNAFDLTTGDATISIAGFALTVRIAAPAGTTHFKVVTGALLYKVLLISFCFHTMSYFYFWIFHITFKYWNVIVYG